MSFKNVMGPELAAAAPLWSQYRDQFPVTERFVYLNHAAVAPLSRPAAERMATLTQDVLCCGSFHYSQWLDAYRGLRDSAARLIGAHSSEIALLKNTSEGIATIAMGTDWRPGDKIVAFNEEFPANSLPWLRLERKGVRIEWLSITDPLERIDQACAGARLLAISFVNFLSGFRVDLNAVGEICRRRGCFFFVDAIQGLGAFPLNVEESHIDALASDGHKWMLGPEGCGFLYVRKERQPEIEPVEFGWTNVADFGNYASRDMTLRPDAGRYECGTLNTVGCFGLDASIRLLLEVGVSRIAPHIQALADRIAEGVQRKGYQVLGQRTPESTSGIVAFRKPGTDCRDLVDKFERAGVIVAPRQGWVRTSPHFYISPDEVDRMLAELP
ncbi:MAG: aminotransferase class V-fold PLP-dependent enzyme [Acidobacteriota bacterium]|nr:aminotransferase class V-fold PLP-dependent enzyme [Acidobacteriota bacterium]